MIAKCKQNNLPVRVFRVTKVARVGDSDFYANTYMHTLSGSR